MFDFVTVGFISLTLVAALFYPLFLQPCLSDKDWVSGCLMGAIFGPAPALMLLTGFYLEGGMMITGVAGPLFFAGYVGGAVTAVVTLVLTLAIRIWFGGAFLPISIVSMVGIVSAGYLLRKRLAFTEWPRFPPRVLKWSLGAYLVVDTAFVLLALGLGLLPANPWPFIAARMVSGIASVTLAWTALSISWHQSAIFREKNVLLRQLEMIFETCGIGAFQFQGDTGRLSYDTSFLKLYGVSVEDALHPGNFAATQVHPEDIEPMQEYIREATTGTGSDGTHIFRAKRADGNFHHMKSVWKLESLNQDGTRNVVGLHIDVTDVIETEERRLAVESQLSALADSLPGIVFQVVWESRSAVRMNYFSPKAAELFGASQEDLIADPYITVSRYEDDDAQIAIDTISQAVESGKPGNARVRIRDTEDNLRVFEMRVQSTPASGATHLVNGIIIDVTREAEAQEQARISDELAQHAQRNESIGRLTGGVAHDFNNLLAVIMGNLELIQENPKAEDVPAMIEASINACNRGATLTRSMLSFARRARLSPVPLDLNAVVRESGNWIRRALPSSISMETSLLAGLWEVELDPVSLESALLNLILNARDAMGGNGRLTIETANMRIDEAYVDSRNEPLPPGRYVMLAVSDTGEGMDEATLARTFEPFFTTKPPGAGSGIGLSMVLGFVRQSGGTVQVYSEPGQGTTFKLYFPTRAAGAAASQIKTVEQAQADKPGTSEEVCRLLLVEDFDDVRVVMARALRDAGYSVVEAASGDAALEIFRADPTFDVVLTDIVMPGEMQGPMLAQAIRKIVPESRIVFMTGYASEAAVHGNGLNPRDIRLMKPVTKAELLGAVQAALVRSEHEEER